MVIYSSIEIQRYKSHQDISIERVDTKDTTQLCEECKNIFSLRQGFIGHTELLTMTIDTGNYPPIDQRP